jgi:hypothetical protein
MSEAPLIPGRTLPTSFPAYSRGVELINMARGGVVFDVDLARTIGETLFNGHYGRDELQRQLPLIVEDKGDYWRVEGSGNRDFKTDDNSRYTNTTDGCSTSASGDQWPSAARSMNFPQRQRICHRSRMMNSRRVG